MFDQLWLKCSKPQTRPLRIEPRIKSYLWGQRAADSFILKFLPPGSRAFPGQEPIAELWFGALRSFPATVRLGGRRFGLDKVLETAGREILGPGTQTLEQLFKILDAGRSLSWQIHDNRPPHSKHECWLFPIDLSYQRETDQDQVIAEAYFGFRPLEQMNDDPLSGFKAAYQQGKTPAERSAFIRSQYSEMLQRARFAPDSRELKAFSNHLEIRWERGEVVLYLNERKQTDQQLSKLGIPQGRLLLNIPGATVHTLCGGSVFELQESADKTYRVYDYGREDAQRPLHIEAGVAKLDCTLRSPWDFLVAPVRLDAKTTNLIRTESYALDEIALEAGDEHPVDTKGRYHMLLVTQGEGELDYLHGKRAKTRTLRLQRGEMLLIPATLPRYRVRSLNRLIALKAYQAAPDEINETQQQRSPRFGEKER